MSHMETIRTFCCKLDPTPEQANEIDATLIAFARACNYIADVDGPFGNQGRGR
jgi:hypothetical protein